LLRVRRLLLPEHRRKRRYRSTSPCRAVDDL